MTDIRRHRNTRLSVTSDLQQGGIPSKDSKKKLKWETPTDASVRCVSSVLTLLLHSQVQVRPIGVTHSVKKKTFLEPQVAFLCPFPYTMKRCLRVGFWTKLKVLILKSPIACIWYQETTVGENQFPRVVLWPTLVCHGHACTHMCTCVIIII